MRHERLARYADLLVGTCVALGNGFPHLGGTNESTIHWDIVEDLRNGGKLYLDGELVQVDGRWLI